ncbi:MAG: SOS response-associated peptidase [Mycobacteriales bacterium]
MCGRYAAAKTVPELLDRFAAADATEGRVRPRYNVAPTQPVPAVVEEDGARLLVVLRWGLIPSWARDRGVGSRMINARAETLAERPAFRSALRRRRCLLPADGFYEWGPPPTPGGRRQPYYLHPADGDVLALAGLHEVWRDTTSGELVRTCTVVTTAAADDVGLVHDRAPLVVPPVQWAAWLDPATPDPVELVGRLAPAVPGLLAVHPVSFLVNNVRHDGPELRDPVPAQLDPGQQV